jgi:L-threonylcarbamoyladenylate synthase
VRHTSHRGIERLVARIGQPLTSTSANRPGGPPAPGADKLVELFRAEVDAELLLVLDGGVLGNVPPSTLVDCTESVPRMVREGAIPRAELRRAAGRLAP